MSKDKKAKCLSQRARDAMWYKLRLLAATVLPARYARHYCGLQFGNVYMSRSRGGLTYDPYSPVAQLLIIDPALVPTVLDADARSASFTLFWPFEIAPELLPRGSRTIPSGFQLFVMLRKDCCSLTGTFGRRQFAWPGRDWRPPGQLIIYNETAEISGAHILGGQRRWSDSVCRNLLLPLFREKLCDYGAGIGFASSSILFPLMPRDSWISALHVTYERQQQQRPVRQQRQRLLALKHTE